MILNNKNNELSIKQILNTLAVTNDPKEWGKTLRELTDIGGDQVYDALLKFLETAPRELRYEVLSVLTKVNPSRSQSILVEVLNNDQDSDMQWVASGLLINVVTVEILVPLTEALLKHPDVQVRVNIVTALDKLGDKRALPALKHARDHDAGKTEDGYSVRWLAERAIQRIESRAKGEDRLQS